MRIWRGPNVWRLDRLLSLPQIDLSACADRKMVIFYVYLGYFTKKSQLYRTDTQIKKKLVCKGKTFAHLPMHICVSVYFLKKSQPKQILQFSVTAYENTKVVGRHDWRVLPWNILRTHDADWEVPLTSLPLLFTSTELFEIKKIVLGKNMQKFRMSP
jgi:hypothetical protein